jgi:flagellin
LEKVKKNEIGSGECPRKGHKWGGDKVPEGEAEEGARCDGKRPKAATQGIKKIGSAIGLKPQINASNKEIPMSLGVLNNLSAVYAENNLSNTNSSLSKTLQQLSSGSKINSGADDAAGLSLVDGLQANQQALTQSQTNATEGVGLLQVADGALSQVTSLLNRAVTLATEVSNGTLNNSQDSAANQEYQSILSEISNIGSTTTYNQNTVFGTTTSIYTGDSTSSGASVDSLNIRSLSSSNLGDSNGTMSYSTGTNNDFIDLSKNSASKNASASDTLGATTATTSITVQYLTKGVDGQSVAASATISAGAGTQYGNTIQGLMSAINNSGLGLTASLGTAAQAGDTSAAAQTDTGIIISGSGVFATTAATPGQDESLLVTNKVSGTEDTLGGSISFTSSDGTTHSLTINAANNDTTATTLAAKINSEGWGVTVADTNTATTDTLEFTSTSPVTVTVSGVTDGSGGTVAGTTQTFNNYSLVTSISDGTTGAAAVTGQADMAGTGAATITYSDSTGANLSNTDLSSQTDAETALTSLNSAIADVAAQDGYVGAQINTLNAVSSVLSTQQENVQSAQNAVQATDYAQASSNMSKYEILSQTGIAALAQANSVQQEVTKLLQ